MSMSKSTLLRLVVPALCSLLFGVSAMTAEAGDKKGYHCEVKKDGKTVDLEDVKTRKDCKEKKGKWVKGHDHDHGAGSDHEHDE